MSSFICDECGKMRQGSPIFIYEYGDVCEQCAEELDGDWEDEEDYKHLNNDDDDDGN